MPRGVGELGNAGGKRGEILAAGEVRSTLPLADAPVGPVR
jgi:hypothetical protein